MLNASVMFGTTLLFRWSRPLAAKRVGLLHSRGSGPRLLSSENDNEDPMPPWGISPTFGVCAHTEE